MERLFWIECPDCRARWYADWELRASTLPLICPRCGRQVRPDEASWIDERPRP
ncbi:MAG: hypothetical protein HY900_15180 [Deltaproteobacteria bacterium]|nr:hypothetical protein [Deltaproteobacteria bacterium]